MAQPLGDLPERPVASVAARIPRPPGTEHLLQESCESTVNIHLQFKAWMQ